MSEVERSLTGAELDRLTDLETTIAAGMQTFVEVGTALAEVRDARLYRAEHATFEEYCRERWNLSRSRAHRLMEAADVVATLPMGNTLPTNERQARELARVEPEQRAEVWAEAVEATGGRPTAAAVTKAADRLRVVREPGGLRDHLGIHADPPQQAVVDRIDAAVRKHAPDAHAAAQLASWRAAFMAAIARSGRLMQFTAADVAQYCDADLHAELHRLLENLARYASEVDRLRGSAHIVHLENRR